MHPIIASLAIAVLLASSSGIARAQVAGRSIDALPGGKTIGGPGVTQWTDSTRSIFTYAAGLDVCATASNVSTGSAIMTLTNTNLQTVTVTLVGGNTQTTCLGLVDSVALTCGPEACKVIWRIDALP